MTHCSCDVTSLQFLSDTSDISTGSFLSSLLFYDLVSRIAESVWLVADVCTSVRRNSMNTNASTETQLMPFQGALARLFTGLELCV